jgi:hypothetical protein
MGAATIIIGQRGRLATGSRHDVQPTAMRAGREEEDLPTVHRPPRPVRGDTWQQRHRVA